MSHHIVCQFPDDGHATLEDVFLKMQSGCLSLPMEDVAVFCPDANDTLLLRMFELAVADAHTLIVQPARFADVAQWIEANWQTSRCKWTTLERFEFRCEDHIRQFADAFEEVVGGAPVLMPLGLWPDVFRQAQGPQ